MEKRRLQFDFAPEALEELDELQRQTGFSSRADLIRHALRLFQWAVSEIRNNDATLLIEKNGQVREVVFPFFGGSKIPRRQNEDRNEQEHLIAAGAGRLNGEPK